MSEQVHKSRQEHVDVEEQIAEMKATKRSEDAQATIDNSSDLLDEIDAVLETNAEEFLKQYVQKGGE